MLTHKLYHTYPSSHYNNGLLFYKKIDLKTNYNKYLQIYNKMKTQPIIENKFTSIGSIFDKGKSTKEGNKGEKDEIKYKKELFEKRMDMKYCTELFGSEAQEGIEVINIETGKPYEDITDIKKSKSASKADTIINLIKTQKRLNISIKSKTGAKPSIINHTPRTANVFQNKYLKDELCYLDMLAKEYIDKRKEGVICEDVEIGKLYSYNDEKIKNSLIKMLIYFTFKGTGSKITKHECNSVLIINKNGSLSFILCDTEKKRNIHTNNH